MSEILSDIAGKKKSEFSKAVNEKDIGSDRNRPELGELFQTFVEAEKKNGTMSPLVIDALTKENRNDAEKDAITEALALFNERLPRAEIFLQWLDTTGMRKTVSECLPIDSAHFGAFIRGMAVRDPDNITFLIEEVTKLQLVSQNKEVLKDYKKARADLLELGGQCQIDEKQLLGLAQLPTDILRKNAVEALLKDSTHVVREKKSFVRQVFSFDGKTTTDIEVNSASELTKRLEVFATAQEGAKSALENVEAVFGLARAEDTKFVEQIEKIATRPPKGNELTLESGRNQSDVPELQKGFEQMITKKYGVREWNDFVKELKSPANAGLSADDFMSTLKVGTSGISYGDVYENYLKERGTDMQKKGFINSFVELLLTALFGREARNNRNAMVDSIRS